MQDCVLEGDHLQVEESWCVSHRHVHAISCRPCHALHRLAAGEVQILEAVIVVGVGGSFACFPRP